MRCRGAMVAWVLGLAAVSAGAQTSLEPSAPTTASQWLVRLHEASQRRAYIGTVVVASDHAITMSRIWHVCDGKRQLERVEALNGPRRSTFRDNEEVVTFSPASGVVLRERRETLGLFPHLLGSDQSRIDEFYRVEFLGSERMTGLDTEVVQLVPADALRYGYRLWSERRTGLVIKMQVLDAAQTVLEQLAFSDLELDAEVSADKLTQMMNDTRGYRVQSPDLRKTRPEDEGWRLKSEVPGFRTIACYRRGDGSAGAGMDNAMQWIFSDGLATVSLFIEAAEPTSGWGRRHRPRAIRRGATHALVMPRRNADAAWRLTLVGEVPLVTLQRFAQNLERRP